MNAAPPIVRVDGVTAGYGDLEILRGVSLEVATGALTTIIGANGAGKSTLLKLIFGIVEATGGRVYFGSEDVTDLDPGRRLEAGTSLVPQGRCNFPMMSVAENLKLGGFARRTGKADLDAEVDRLVRRFPILKDRWRTLAGNLSGGEQQILEMAMVLVNRPRLLLLDEPSLGLSPKFMDMIFDEIRRLVDDGVSVLMVEQNAVQALERSDYGVVMELGRISLADGARDVLEHPDIRRLYLGI